MQAAVMALDLAWPGLAYTGAWHTPGLCTGTAADVLIRMAGGVNAVSDYEGYKQITDEAVGLAAPDVILMMDRGGDHGVADDELFAMPAISLTPAAQTRSVVRMDGLLMLGFGPRTASAVRDLNAALYGQES